MTSFVAESWGRYPRVQHRLIAPHPFVDSRWPAEGAPLLARGNGRSYGDSCLNAGGTLLDTRRMDRLLAFDAGGGALRAEAGVLLAEVIERFLPEGWFPPVVPGTRWVTLGGAVANDVHGKNHARHGSFGCHVSALGLRRSDGRVLELRPGDPSGLFEATVGGLGLTGVITWVELRLRRVPGAHILQTRQRIANLDEYFARVETEAGAEYRVAWIDCLAGGPRLGRGYLSSADHAEDGSGGAPPLTGAGSLAVPFAPPIGVVNRWTLRPFNALCYGLSPLRPETAAVGCLPFFFPLDRIAHWNRLYGAAGFVQYQCVIPKHEARASVRALLQAIADAGRGSMLAVLKEFGPTPSPGLLSFPMEGTTLALDFPNPDAALFRLFERLDGIVADAGGRLYPAKDARWPGHRFRAAYPQWARLESLRDPAFSSSLWRRVLE